MLSKEVTEGMNVIEKLQEEGDNLKRRLKAQNEELANSKKVLKKEILKRQRVEEALRESEEQKKTLLESFEDGYFEADLAGNLTFFNKALCRMLGYSHEEMMGMNNRQYTTPETSKKVYETYNEVFRTGKAKKASGWEFMTKDGKVRRVETSVSPVYGLGGERVGFRGIARDVTERCMAEQACRESEEKYREIIESIEEGYYEVDLQGNLVFFNEGLKRILGYSSEEMSGMNNRQYMSEETAKIAYQTFNEVYRTGKPSKAFDWKLIRKNDERRLIETSVSLILDSNGSAIGFRGIARDITDRKKMIQELETLNQVREKFVSHLSHELITPIALVEASLGHLANPDLSEPLKEKIVQRIRRNLDRLKDLQKITWQLLAPRGYKARPLQVDLFIQNVLENALSKSAHRSLDFAIHLEPIYTDIIDPVILEMVLSTLVKNSIESTPDEGRIVISLSRTSEGVLLQVQDHGVGIVAGDKEFILRGFYHTQNTNFYSTRRPFDFNAGGKGLELMRLKLFAADAAFDIFFESERCKYIPTDSDTCCGRISSCRWISSVQECIDSGGTTFSVLFFKGPADQMQSQHKETLSE